MCFKISLKRLESCNRAIDESNLEGDSVRSTVGMDVI